MHSISLARCCHERSSALTRIPYEKSQNSEIITYSDCGNQVDALSIGVCSCAAQHGHVHVLEWAMKNGFVCDSCITDALDARGMYTNSLIFILSVGKAAAFASKRVCACVRQ